jgi:hypothetical protein
VNQQKLFELTPDDRVKARHGLGFYAAMDLGIAKYHFECGKREVSGVIAISGDVLNELSRIWLPYKIQ